MESYSLIKYKKRDSDISINIKNITYSPRILSKSLFPEVIVNISPKNESIFNVYSNPAFVIKSIDLPTWKKTKIYKSLSNNIKKSVINENAKLLEKIISKLETIPYESVFAQYDSYDKSFVITLNFKEDIKVNIIQFVEDEDDNVVMYSIYKNHELLKSDDAYVDPLVDILKKLNSYV